MKNNEKVIEICLPHFNLKRISNDILQGIKDIVIYQRFEDNRIYSLDFLKDVQGIENIESLRIVANCSSFTFLEFFSNLNKLSIGNGKTIQKIDLSKLLKLKALNVAGEFDVQGIEQLHLESVSVSDAQCFPFEKLQDGIKELYLRNVKVEFKQISHIKSLCKLEIVQVKNESFRGINFNNIESVSIAYCPKLSDYSFLTQCKKVKYMELEKCRNISAELLGELVSIEKLILIDCGEIESLGFIHNLQSLKFFTFWGTTVLSGDLTPCLKLEYAATNSKKSYNLKDKDLPKNLHGSVL